MKRTVPQIIMLNYSATREQKNAEIRAKEKARLDKEDEQKQDEDPYLESVGCRKSELADDPEKWERYLSSVR